MSRRRASHHYTPTAGPAGAAGRDRRRRPSATRVCRSTPSQVLVTNGAKHAVANAFATLLDPGDEVLLTAPYWTTYPEAIALAGGVPVFVPTDESTGFRASAEVWERYASDRRPRSSFSSRRPTRPGPSIPRPRSRESASLPLERGWWVVTDEIYEHPRLRRAQSTTRCRPSFPSSPSAA